MSDVHEAMFEMGQQSDPIREALRRMLAEFGDQHYDQCPANWIEGHENYGPCDCFAGHLVKDVLAIFNPPPVEPIAWRIRVNKNGMTYHEYTERLPFEPDEDSSVKVISEPEPVYLATPRELGREL